MEQEPGHVEEAFGILTDDDIYLDCILVKPNGMADDEMQALRIWVPRYPLTKGSVITCARQEVDAYGLERGIAHLVFDLRGTGDSEGQATDRRFDRDLEGLRLWAVERFGDIDVSYLGMPIGHGAVDVRPLRPGVVMELYHYALESETEAPSLLYLATFGNFNRLDDARCTALARAGFTVHGLDPLRYLLHASARDRLTVQQLGQDLNTLLDQLEIEPFVIGLPVSAGLALLWASLSEAIHGVVAVGSAQIAFRPRHIFANDTPHTFFLGRHVHRIGPATPAVLVQHQQHPLGGNQEELNALYQTLVGPRRQESVAEVSPAFLESQISWLQAPDETERV